MYRIEGKVVIKDNFHTITFSLKEEEGEDVLSNERSDKGRDCTWVRYGARVRNAGLPVTPVI
jgi:hypothetical protein